MKYSNSKAVLLPSKTTKGAMAYLYIPSHPDSDKRGLWELGAVASPTFFKYLPQKDVIDADGDWVRGYGSFFRRLSRARDPRGRMVFYKKDIKALIPNAYQHWKGKDFKAQWLADRVTPEEKLDKKIPWRRIDGYGDPLGGMRETDTVYSFGG